MNQNNAGFLSSIPLVTRNLLIINVLVWFAQFVLLRQGIDLSQYLGLHYFESQHFGVHQLLTSMFLHDPTGIGHLFFNMFAVFMFGRVLESIWGPKRFLIYYLVAGIGAGIIQELSWVYDLREVIFNPDIQTINLGTRIVARQELFDMVTAIGASGAVFGILVAFGMIFPNVQLMLIFPPIPIKAKWFVIGYGVMELFLGVGNFSGDSVAHFAHLGGLLTGLIMLLYWKKKGTLYGNLRRH